MITVWKLVGLFGAGLFASRWVLQYLATCRAGRPVVPPAFWMASLVGSAILLAYFAFGPQRDAIGFLGNLLPAALSIYNLSLLPRQGATVSASLPGTRSSARPATGAGVPSTPAARFSTDASFRRWPWTRVDRLVG